MYIPTYSDSIDFISAIIIREYASPLYKDVLVESIEIFCSYNYYISYYVCSVSLQTFGI